MGSVAGYVAAPGASAYAMSKFATRALAESLRAELGREGVGVTLISPAYVDSDIRRTDNRGQLPRRRPRIRSRHGCACARRAPRASWPEAIARGRDEVVVTLHGKLIVFLARHFHRTRARRDAPHRLAQGSRLGELRARSRARRRRSASAQARATLRICMRVGAARHADELALGQDDLVARRRPGRASAAASKIAWYMCSGGSCVTSNGTG